MSFFFEDRTYSDDVEIYDIGLKCHPEDKLYVQYLHRPIYRRDKTVKDLFFPDKTIHYYKDLEIEIEVNFNLFRHKPMIEHLMVVRDSILDYLQTMRYPVVLRKSFDRERFNNDMRQFFDEFFAIEDLEGVVERAEYSWMIVRAIWKLIHFIFYICGPEEGKDEILKVRYISR
ncbi:MAG: hypothetical protein NC206_11000 [Bacteroides sp.]|nr:hypothetical protein [Bacteroides sp.]